jgi:hypothetical protein
MTKRILAILTVVALAGALALLFASAQHSARPVAESNTLFKNRD